MTPSQYFMDSQSIAYNEIVDYVADQYLNGELPFLLRELTTDSKWQVEAYFSYTLQGVRMYVVFAEDVLSPYKNYNQVQVSDIIDDIHDKYRNVRTLLKTLK